MCTVGVRKHARLGFSGRIYDGDGQSEMTLVAVDIGGTNVRFAVVGKSGLTCQVSVLCQDHPTFEDAFSAYLSTLDTKVTAASIAVAGPVQAPHVEVTNNGWHFGKRDLMATLGLDQLLVVNDFTAQALAQSDPKANGNLAILGGAGQADAPLLVIGPGTGLGVAALVSSPAGLVTLEGEGGHVGFAPQDSVELDLLRRLWEEQPHVSAEDFVSGSGLETIYRLQSGDRLKAPEIGAAALAQKGPAREAVNRMLAMLGTVMADAALSMGCWRGAVIAGGIVAQLRPLLDASPFAARFRHQGKMGRLLSDIPVWLSVDPQAGLRGAAAAFDNASLQPRKLSAD